MHLPRCRPSRLLSLGAVPLLGFGLLVCACSGGAGGGGNVMATANDFNFTLDQSHAPAGKTHFTFKNNSQSYQHEFVIYPANQPKIQDLLTAEAGGQTVNASDYLQNIAGSVAALDPGKTSSFDATLAPGTYEYACFVTTTIAGKNQVHYNLGMHGTFTVP